MASSSLWAALGGLGDAAQEIGMAKFKSTMADKLEQQREARAEQRQIDRENRQEQRSLGEVKGTRYFERDGAWFEEDYNKAGRALDTRLAPKDWIEKRNREQVKADQDEQLKDLQITDALYKQGEGRSLSERLLNAQIDAANALGDQRRASAAFNDRRDGSRSGSAVGGTGVDGKSLQDYANLLASDPSTKSYLTSLSEEYTPQQVNELQKWAAAEAARTGVDPRTLLLEAQERGESIFSRYDSSSSNSGFPGALQITLPERKN